jgi:hypothetical protein
LICPAWRRTAPGGNLRESQSWFDAIAFETGMDLYNFDTGVFKID